VSYPVDQVELSAAEEATRAPPTRAKISPAAKVAASKPVSGPVGFVDSAIEVVDLEPIGSSVHYPVNYPGSVALDQECGHFTIAH